MMSPQANFAMNYGYGYSPAHAPSHYKHSPANGGGYGGFSSSLKQAAPGLSTVGGHKAGDDRESPSTVETITESETLSEAP